jgi:hypothetical protein
MVLSLGQVFMETFEVIDPQPLYIGFPVIAIASSLITIVVSLVTQPTDIATLKNFYRKVQPAGLWAPARAAVKAEDPGFKKQLHFRVELFNTVIAMIGITALYVSMLYLVLHRLEIGFALLATTALSVVVLYFTWYKTLPPPSEPPSEELQNLEEQTDEIGGVGAAR